MMTLYRALAERARGQYDAAYSLWYRECDAKGVGTPTHADYEGLITAQCLALNRSLDVLDLGCGTGRYFHCLKNVKSLTGIDISPDMLRQAKQPVGPPLTFMPQLRCGNLSDVTLPPASFDLIYSIGVLGEFMPCDAFLCARIASWLRPGGRFVFTVLDRVPQPTSWKRELAKGLAPLLPGPIKDKVRARIRDLAVTEEALRELVSTQFSRVTITPRQHPGKRRHLICIAER